MNDDGKSFLTQIGTGKDNKTHDAFRWMAVLSIMVALGLTIFVVGWRSKEFDIQSFGIGIGAVLAAAGAALKLKESTEPDPVNKNVKEKIEKLE